MTEPVIARLPRAYNRATCRRDTMTCRLHDSERRLAVNRGSIERRRRHMKCLRRAFLKLTAGSAALPAVSRLAWPQAYPSRLVTLIVGFAPGVPTDVPTRLMAHMPSARL